MKPIVYISSNYAVLTAGPIDYYYGYEFGDVGEENFGFEAKKDSKSVFRVEFSEDWKLNKFNCAECLLYGIGLFIASRISQPEGEDK